MRRKLRAFGRRKAPTLFRLGPSPDEAAEPLRLPRSIALLAAVAFLFAAPTAQAARSEFFGIAHGPTLDDTDLQTMAATKVKTDRILLSWRRVQPSSGRFDWRATDRVVGGLASHGIRGVPVASGSPAWAGTGGPKRPPVNNESAQRAWEEFLTAAVARYGRGGSYWTDGYHQQFGEAAVPLPVQSWQIWNEPNLYEFYPGATVAQAAARYGELLQVSHDAVRSKDWQAEIVLAGIATQNSLTAFDFLDSLYSVPGIKGDFDAVAQHPYASNVDNVRSAIEQLRQVMANNGDAAKPLWITELGWGSAPADGLGINLGLAGQASMLTSSFKLILSHRSDWNVQRLYWFDWRDPAPDSPYADICLRCGSAGLLAHDRTPKPAFDAFLAFTAETIPPSASITMGPSQGSLITDPTPTFSFTSSEAGSTFACRTDAGPFSACASRFTAPGLSNGLHSFSVKAIDAAGNESAIVSRSFTVDTTAPQTMIDAGPSGTTNDPTPTFAFSSTDPGSSFECKVDSRSYAACSSPLTQAQVADGSHTFSVRAIDPAGNTDPTPDSRTFTVATASVTVSDSALVITAAPGAKDNLAITQPSASNLRVTDFPAGAYAGSGIHTGPGCTRSGDYTANCFAGGITPVLPMRVTSADQGDKVVNSSGLPSSLYGGTGNDSLEGGTADDILNGGAGADLLSGMDGNDVLLAHDGASDQTIDCAGGSDKAGLDLLPQDFAVSHCETKTRY